MPNKHDRQQFESQMLCHMEAAYNLARWLLRDPMEAEDVVQTAYIKAFKAFKQFKGGNASAWLLTIVRNTAFNTIKQRKRVGNLVSFDEALLDNSGSDVHSLNASQIPPEELLDNDIVKQHIDKAIGQLPLKYREVIYLREIEGYSYKEIAEILDIASGTVMSRLSRGRSSLRKTLTAYQNRGKTDAM